MSDASLTARLNLDGKGFSGGLDDAGKKTQQFSEKFKSELSESRRGIKETQHSVVGMSEAMDGSFKGAVHAFRGLTGLMVSNPILAAVAAVTAAVVFGIKRWEEYENAAGEAIDKSTKAWSDAQKVFREAMGITRKPEEIAKAMVGATGVNDLDALIAREKKKADELRKIANQASDNLTFSTKRGMSKERIAFDAADLEESSKKEKEQAEFVKMLEKEAADKKKEFQREGKTAFDKEVADEKRESEEKTKREEKQADDAKKFVREISKLQKNAAREEADASEGAQKRIAELHDRSWRSRFDNVDSLARMGGQIGSQANPALRAADIQAQLAKDTKKILEDMKGRVDSIESKFSQAVQDLGDNQ